MTFRKHTFIVGYEARIPVRDGPSSIDREEARRFRTFEVSALAGPIAAMGKPNVVDATNDFSHRYRSRSRWVAVMRGWRDARRACRRSGLATTPRRWALHVEPDWTEGAP